MDNPNARGFYEAEALRGGWSVRQLRRQIGSQFYERTALSKDKAGMLIRGRKPRPEDAITPTEEVKDPFVLEFLELKDQYSESELEESLIRHMESFLLGACPNPNICSCSRMAAGFRWALAFSASAQP